MNDKKLKLLELFAELNDDNKVLAMNHIEDLTVTDCLKGIQDKQ